jgi:hypothetical protein
MVRKELHLRGLYGREGKEIEDGNMQNKNEDTD